MSPAPNANAAAEPGRPHAGRTPEVDYIVDTDGGHRWHLQDVNGEIVAQGEAYTRAADAKRGWYDALDAALAWAAANRYAGPSPSPADDPQGPEPQPQPRPPRPTPEGPRGPR